MSKVCTDHLGNKYRSFSDMCNAYNQKRTTVQQRLKKGYTLKEALLNCGYTVKDHKNNEYKSFNEMCRHYSKIPETVSARIKNGYSLKDALEEPIKTKAEIVYQSSRVHKCIDHKGNIFPSQTMMVKAYNTNKRTFLSRIEAGWSLQDALEGNDVLSRKSNNVPIKDFKGVIYPSMEAMCRNYGVISKTVSYRLSQGATLEEALTLPKNMYIGEHRVAECLKRLNVKFYHDCSIKTIFTDLGISVDWNDFLSILQSKLGSAGYNWSKQKIQRLRPDFILCASKDNKIRGVIEFDGEQHQNFIEFFFKTIEEFYRRSDTDLVKQSFWEYMDIPMLRIRHDQIDMIDNMIQDFINNPQDYIHNHNTYLSEEEYWSILTEQKQQLELAFT